MTIKNKIKKAQKPLIIFISGIPATGKSTLAIKLAAKLDIKVCVGVDEVKEVVKIYDKNPFVHRSSHDCWQLIGERNKKNILLGYKKYCYGLKNGVGSIINRSKNNGENAIIEGVHLLPEIYLKTSELNVFYFLITSNFGFIHKKNIKKRLIERHKMQDDVWSERYPELKIIQNEMIMSANKFRCNILKENSISNQVKEIVKILEENEIY